MHGYGQFYPVARASEIFAERWTPLVLREVISGHHHFNEILKGLHRISPSVLGQRLRTLERAGIIEARANPSGRGSTYYISPAGKPLVDVFRVLLDVVVRGEVEGERHRLHVPRAEERMDVPFEARSLRRHGVNL